MADQEALRAIAAVKRGIVEGWHDLLFHVFERRGGRCAFLPGA